MEKGAVEKYCIFRIYQSYLTVMFVLMAHGPSRTVEFLAKRRRTQMEIAIFIGVTLIIQMCLKKLNINIGHDKIILGFIGTLFVISAMLGLALFLLRSGKYSSGINMFYIPIVISILSFFGLLKVWKNRSIRLYGDYPFETSVKSLMAISAPLIIIVLADYSFKLPIYTPKTINISDPSPTIAVIVYILLAIIFAFSAFYCIEVNGDSLSKTIILSLVGYFIFQTTLHCLTLMYGLIHRYEISYTFWAGVLSLAFIPMIALLINSLLKKK